jgi:quinol monooxygenase YgiN
MTIVVITRLRLRDPAWLDAFFAAASAALDAALKSDGNVGGDAIAEANNTWWTSSAWQDRASIGAFVRSDAHRRAMDGMNDWCDEATFVDWEQDDDAVPDWQTAYQHLVADGRSAKLPHGTPENDGRDFPAPVITT